MHSCDDQKELAYAVAVIGVPEFEDAALASADEETGTLKQSKRGDDVALSL